MSNQLIPNIIPIKIKRKTKCKLTLTCKSNKASLLCFLSNRVSPSGNSWETSPRKPERKKTRTPWPILATVVAEALSWRAHHLALQGVEASASLSLARHSSCKRVVINMQWNCKQVERGQEIMHLVEQIIQIENLIYKPFKCSKI